MPRFLNEILENNKSVPTSSNDTIADMVYVTEEEYNNLVKNNQLKNNTVYMIDDELSANTENTVLWENPSTDNKFMAQTITLKNSDYDYLIIFSYRNSNGSKNITLCHTVEKNKSTKMYYADYFDTYVRAWHRDVSVTQGNKVTFGDAYINGDVGGRQ